MTTTDPARPAAEGIDPFERRLRRLEDALVRYGRHQPRCQRSVAPGYCTCGLAQMLASLKAEGRG